MLRYCALSRSLVKIRLQDTSLPHFSKTLRSLCLILSWRAVVKSKNKLTTIFDRVFSSYMYTFFSQFSTRADRKSVAKRAGCSKNPLFFALKISFIQWGINETITRLSWKFEENRTSGRFYFFKQKKEHKKWNPLYSTHLPLKVSRDTFHFPWNANFLFSVFRMVQGEAKTPKIMGCCTANFAFLPALKIGTFVENEHSNECSKPHFLFAWLFIF